MEVLGIILLFILVMAGCVGYLFLWSKVSRLFKKKSHHYIEPPVPEKDKDWYPIDFSDYSCFIFINKVKGREILDLLYSTGYQAEDLDYIYKNFEINYKGSWYAIKVSNASFEDFKTLVIWFEINFAIDYEPNVYGFCRHKTKFLQDYLFTTDKGTAYEDLYGSFRNGQNFGIYLPNAGLNPSGNISLSRNNEMNFNITASKLPMECIDMEMISLEKLFEILNEQSFPPKGFE
ncbi:MAG: hypothetical protein A2W91_00245 [Bacteroidetes bacterium GWF2_38_335]|nr:MAG: hypothetical protein A2W91_00245 [Bacteroidetes bacterium GWF2_38_335]OFY78264.1 MAG: hypothetical protein A2281_03625 [Bacteroidetes bacterium RIFOXYA12_FULL_38_20]HBS87543.1 hypothetical protein [Bacteroidales bacterium]